MITISRAMVLFLALLVGVTAPTRAGITVMGNVLDLSPDGDPTDGTATDLRVGDSGIGVLVMDGGSTLTVDGDTVLIGTFGGAHGAVFVSGGGSRLEVTSSVHDFVVAEGQVATFAQDGVDRGIRAAATGTLAVVQGGVVKAGRRLIVGNLDAIGTAPDINGFATGLVTVDGSGSRLETDESLTVGSFRSGTLSVTNGGVVATGTLSNTEAAFLAFGPGSAGHVAVRGPGSMWTHTNGIVVGTEGAGSLVVDGAWASVEADGLMVGLQGWGSVAAANGGVVSSSGSVPLRLDGPAQAEQLIRRTMARLGSRSFPPRGD